MDSKCTKKIIAWFNSGAAIECMVQMCMRTQLGFEQLRTAGSQGAFNQQSPHSGHSDRQYARWKAGETADWILSCLLCSLNQFCHLLRMWTLSFHREQCLSTFRCNNPFAVAFVRRSHHGYVSRWANGCGSKVWRQARGIALYWQRTMLFMHLVGASMDSLGCSAIQTMDVHR